MFGRKKRLERAGNVRIDEIGGSGRNGWNGMWGPEVIHQHCTPRIKRGDQVLDLCSGYGRASIPLAMNGARVTLVDKDEKALESAEEVFLRSGLRSRLERTVQADARSVTPQMLGRRFRAIVVSDGIHHMPKPKAIRLVSKLPDFLSRKGGVVYVNGPSKQCFTYDSVRASCRRIGPDTFEQMCSCSGEPKLEPLSFYGPGDMEIYLEERGGTVIHARDRRVSRHNSSAVRDVVVEFKRRPRKKGRRRFRVKLPRLRRKG